MVSSKGKEKLAGGDKGAAGKRKIDLSGGKDDDKTGKRKRTGVLQFFEDSAFEVGEDECSDDSDFFDTGNMNNWQRQLSILATAFLLYLFL